MTAMPYTLTQVRLFRAPPERVWPLPTTKPWL